VAPEISFQSYVTFFVLKKFFYHLSMYIYTKI